MTRRNSAEWLALLEEAEVPAGPVNALEDLFDDPHLAHRKLFQPFEHPSEGETLQVRPPFGFSRSPAAVYRHAPRLGEHTVEALREAGVEASRIDALLRDGAAVQAD